MIEQKDEHTHNAVLRMVWAHPPGQGGWGQWGFQAVHVEQQGTVVTLD